MKFKTRGKVDFIFLYSSTSTNSYTGKPCLFSFYLCDESRFWAFDLELLFCGWKFFVVFNEFSVSALRLDDLLKLVDDLESSLVHYEDNPTQVT